MRCSPRRPSSLNVALGDLGLGLVEVDAPLCSSRCNLPLERVAGLRERHLAVEPKTAGEVR
jgi:hypothetical protein